MMLASDDKPGVISSGEMEPMAALTPEEEALKMEQEREKHYQKRRFIAKEIIETERTYIGHLSDIVGLYLRPMERGVAAGLAKSPPAKIGKEIPSEADFKALFSFILDIYNLNTQFLHNIEQMMPHIEGNHHQELQMGNAFLDVTDSFKFYSAFVNSYDKSLDALARVEPTHLWADIMRKVDNLEREERPLSFQALLVTPIQRIPRYLLLLTDLLRHTPPDHPDHEKLNVVLPKMEEVANHINNEKSKFDNLTIIHTLSNTISGYDDSFLKPGRRYLREGVIYQYSGETLRSKQRYAFLFSDIMLLTQSKRGSAMPLLKKNSPKFQYLTSLQLFACKVSPPEEFSGLGIKYGFKLKQADGSFWVLFHNVKREVESWYQSLKDAIEEAQASCISSHEKKFRSLPPLRLSRIEDTGEVSPDGTRLPSNEGGSGRRGRSVTDSASLERNNNNNNNNTSPTVTLSPPPSPSIPPPLNLPLLSSTLGAVPLPQLGPQMSGVQAFHSQRTFTLPTPELGEHSSSSSTSDHRRIRRTLSELMESQAIERSTSARHLDMTKSAPVDTVERERRNSHGNRKEVNGSREVPKSRKIGITQQHSFSGSLPSSPILPTPITHSFGQRKGSGPILATSANSSPPPLPAESRGSIDTSSPLSKRELIKMFESSLSPSALGKVDPSRRATTQTWSQATGAAHSRASGSPIGAREMRRPSVLDMVKGEEKST